MTSDLPGTPATSDELVQAVLDARAAHVFADWTTCACGFQPDDLNGWKRHHAEVTVAAVRPLIEAEARAHIAELIHEFADSEYSGARDMHVQERTARRVAAFVKNGGGS